jgi:Protein of unknown function (DUF559)
MASSANRRHRRPVRPADRSEDPAGGEWRFTSDCPKSNAKRRLAAVADRQFGRVRYDQIRALGVGHATISDWKADGYLFRVLPRVYGVGHAAPSVEADLAAAVLYAGPGAMLSHATAVWWLGLLKHPPAEIIVSSPRRVTSRDGIVVHGRRTLERDMHRGLPVAQLSQTILDFAATGSRRLLRLVLANADYHDLLDVNALQELIRPGVHGGPALREALRIHLPQLALTRSELEVLLLTFCETQGIPIPLTNVSLHGHLVDAYWPDQRLIVEVDGVQGHRTPAQVYADHQRDLELRTLGYIVLRYTWRQLEQTPAAVAADIRRYL